MKGTHCSCNCVGISVRPNSTIFVKLNHLVSVVIAYTRFWPFSEKYKNLNHLEFWILCCKIFTFLTGVMFNDSYMSWTGRKIITIFLVLSNSLLITWFGWSVYSHVIKHVRKARMHKNLQFLWNMFVFDKALTILDSLKAKFR